MNTCLICGIGEEKEGIYFDGYWFCCMGCLNVYLAFTGKEYAEIEVEKAA